MLDLRLLALFELLTVFRRQYTEQKTKARRGFSTLEGFSCVVSILEPVFQHF